MFDMASLFNIVASAAAGADGAEQGLLDPNLLANITGILVPLIAVTLLIIFVWPKILKGLDDRNDKILSEIHSAEEAREQAKSALNEESSEEDSKEKER